MSQTHDGTRRYCGSCMRLQNHHDPDGRIYCNTISGRSEITDTGEQWKETIPGCDACKRYLPSIAAQRLEQARIRNELAGLMLALETARAADEPGIELIANRLSKSLTKVGAKIRGPQ